MEWYNYLSGFGAAFFLINAIPHYIAGVQGKRFTSPFAKSPGKGLSSPTVNVIWAISNMIIGGILFYYAKISMVHHVSIYVFIGSAILMSLLLSFTLKNQDKE